MERDELESYGAIAELGAGARMHGAAQATRLVRVRDEQKIYRGSEPFVTLGKGIAVALRSSPLFLINENDDEMILFQIQNFR